MKRVYPIIAQQINDGDLAQRLGNMDLSNAYDMAFYKGLANGLRMQMGTQNITFSFIASVSRRTVLAVGFPVTPAPNQTFEVHFDGESGIPYIIA